MGRSILALCALFAVGCGADSANWGAADGRSGSPVRVATYNIHHWVGEDGRADVERIATVVEQLDVDVVAIQEADNNLISDTGVRRQQMLAELLGHDWVRFGRDEEPLLAAHGNAVLVAPHVEVVSARFTDVSEPGRDPRAFTETVLEVRGQRVRLVGTHLGLKLGERHRQIEKIGRRLSHVEDVEQTVLLGDFNEWNPFARTFGAVRRLLRDSDSARSFPAGGPLFRLDRIWTSEHAAVEHVEVMRTTQSVVASDHLPVRAEIYF